MKFRDEETGHYRTAYILGVIAVVVLALGFGVGWATAGHFRMQADRADNAAAQAKTSEAIARSFLQQQCDSGDQPSACDAIEALESQPKQNTDSGVVSVPGPKGDKGDTGSTGAQGPQGPSGPRGFTGLTGSQGPTGTGSPGPSGPPGGDGSDGSDGSNGVNGQNGNDGRGVTGITCNADQHFVVTYTTGTSDVLLGSDCFAVDGKDGQDGAQGPQGPAGTANAGDYTCPDNQFQTGFSVSENGSVTLHCSPFSILP